MRPTGVNALIVAVRKGTIPALSSLRAIWLRSDLGTSRFRSPTTRAALRNRLCNQQLGLGRIEIVKRPVGARDELRDHNGLGPRVERRSVQQKAECSKVRRTMLLRLHALQHLGNERLDQGGLRLSWQTFERARKADKFRRRSSRANIIELACQQYFLPFSREAACHPSPEDVFLNLVALARKVKSRIAQPPQLVHPKRVVGKAKPGPQQKPGQREPCLFVLQGKLSAGHPFIQGRPKVTQKSRVPRMPGQAEDAFEMLQECISGQLVGRLCSSRVAERAVRQRQWAGLGSNNRVDTVTVESILKAGCCSSPTSII
jgi:hypothetical protein